MEGTADIVQRIMITGFCSIEALLIIIMLLKGIAYTAYKKIKDHYKISVSFWFYIFFGITYLIGSLLCVLVMNIPMDVLYKQIYEYITNIFYIASFIYLQVYSYKVVAIYGQDWKDIGKRIKQLKRIEKSITLYSIINILFLSLFIGLFPLFKENPDLNIDPLACICIFISMLAMITMLLHTDSGKIHLKKWVWFTNVSFLLFPFSILAEHFNQCFAYSMIKEQVLAMSCNAVFLTLRLIRLFILGRCAFSIKDMKVLSYE